MQSNLQVDYGKIKEKYANFKKLNRPAILIAIAGIVVPFGILVTVGAEGEPQYNEYRIVAGVIFAILIAVAAVFRKASHKYLTASEELMYMHAFEVITALKAYYNTELQADKNKAKSALGNLIEEIDSKWKILEKAGNDQLSNFDYVVNPVVKLVLILKRSYLPMFESGSKDEIVNTMPYFEKMMFFFYRPSEIVMNELINSAKPAEILVEKETEPSQPLKHSNLLRHFAVFGGSVVAGFVAFYVLLPFSPDNIFQPLTISLTTVFGICGVYVAFLRKQ